MSPQIDGNRPYIPTSQAEKLSGLTKNYFTHLLRKGNLEGFRLGRDWFIYKDSLESFLQTHRKPGPKGPRKKSIEKISSTSVPE